MCTWGYSGFSVVVSRPQWPSKPGLFPECLLKCWASAGCWVRICWLAGWAGEQPAQMLRSFPPLLFLPTSHFLSPTVQTLGSLLPDPGSALQLSLQLPSHQSLSKSAIPASSLNPESIHFSPSVISHHSTLFISFLALITVCNYFYLCLCLLVLCVSCIKM